MILKYSSRIGEVVETLRRLRRPIGQTAAHTTEQASGEGVRAYLRRLRAAPGKTLAGTARRQGYEGFVGTGGKGVLKPGDQSLKDLLVALYTHPSKTIRTGLASMSPLEWGMVGLMGGGDVPEVRKAIRERRWSRVGRAAGSSTVDALGWGLGRSMPILPLMAFYSGATAVGERLGAGAGRLVGGR